MLCGITVQSLSAKCPEWRVPDLVSSVGRIRVLISGLWVGTPHRVQDISVFRVERSFTYVLISALQLQI